MTEFADFSALDRASACCPYDRVLLRLHQIGAGKTVKLRTGKGKNVSGTVHWNRGSYVWNNTGDAARLIKPNGKLQDSCSWCGARGPR